MPANIPASIHELLTQQARLHADRLAVGDGDGRNFSYAQLHAEVERLVGELHGAGIDKQARVSIIMPNGIDLAITLLAVSCFATAVPLNPAYRADEYSAYFTEIRVKWVVVPEDHQSPALDVARAMGIGIIRISADGELAVLGPNQRTGKLLSIGEIASGAEDICLILLTSGSTGRSKKVPLSHRNVLVSTSEICETLSLTPQDTCLCMWEQFHIGGLVDLLLVPLASGGGLVCAGSFNARRLYDLLQPCGITWFQAVPTTLHELTVHAHNDPVDLSGLHLRFIRSVASALSPALMQEIEALFDVPVVQTFGMTEAGPLITTNRLPPGPRKAGSVGYSCGPDIKVVAPDGMVLGPGQIGEIAIRGENVISGYEDAPEANQHSFRDGWFHTGDTGYLDDDKFLFLTGRLKEMINRGGEKITPQEVDDVLQMHPKIAQAAAFSVAHKVLGEDVAVAVVFKPGQSLTQAEMRAHVAQHLASFKVPQRIYVYDKMPRDPVGKINRLSLATQAATLAAQRAAAAQGSMSDAQSRIARIWADELKLPQVGLDDNFFEIGGHSLAGVRVFLAIEAEFGRQLPPEAWSSITTVRELARLVEAGAKQGNTPAFSNKHLTEDQFRKMAMVMNAGSIKTIQGIPTMKIINPEGKKTPLLWVFNSPDREMGGLLPHWDNDQPLLGLFSGSRQLSGDDQMLEKIAAYYAELIIGMFPQGGFHLGGNCRGAKVAFKIMQIANKARVSPRRVIIMEHVNELLLSYPGEVLLLFGKQSGARSYRGVDMKKAMAESSFAKNKAARWIDGQHGEFFLPRNVKLLARRLLAFNHEGKTSILPMENLRSWVMWKIHRSDRLFNLLVWLHGLDKKYLWRAGDHTPAGRDT